MCGVCDRKAGQPLAVGTCNSTDKSSVPAKLKILTVSVFFDGTGNNRFNTEIARKDTKLRKKSVSYDNFYSNVALLYMAMKHTTSHKKIYIQGAGTFKYKKDELTGLAGASGNSGYEQRVNEAFLNLTKLVKDNKATRLVLNIYGFSRGSAYGRYFCYRLKRKYINQKLAEPSSVGLDSSCVSINLVGLFDTVSSFNLTGHYSNVEPYGLDVNKSDEGINRIVHLTSENDYREHFPLTSINSAIKEKIGFECSLPGAHSDIGGGYSEEYEEKEKYLGYESLLKTSENLDFIYWKWFLDKGYYSSNQISQKQLSDLNKTPITVYGTRKVFYTYQFVIAEIMLEVMKKETNITVYEGSELLKGFNLVKNISFLKDYRNLVVPFVVRNYKNNGKFKAPVLSEALMKKIYNKYIHISLDFYGSPGNPANKGTPLNKYKNSHGQLDFMRPKRPLVTKGYK